ncbi:MAG: TetR/AcrR family transcriptional regulator [Actinobacteria bacterium]|nr:TetR/AcrR family transcriptional regulator [Actinomycetota bacterium]MCL5886153.1 TetR/AcrR family transcriptional regulator [Actinomycetota bacterium]
MSTAIVPARKRPARVVKRAVSEEEKEGRRNDILAAAKEVFAKSGYQATTIADIAKVAKLSYGSIYWYFDSKEALFHALMENEEQQLRDHVTNAITQASTGHSELAPLQAAVKTTLEFFESDRAVVKLLFRDSYALGDRFEKHLFYIYEGFISDIEVMVKEAQKNGKIIEAPPRMVAFCVVSLVGQVAHRRLVTDDGLAADVVADFVVSFVLNGLLPR